MAWGPGEPGERGRSEGPVQVPQATTPGADPRLAARFDFNVVGTTVGELVSHMGSKADLALESAEGWEAKVSVFGAKLPLGEAADKVAAALGGSWVSRGRVWVLERPKRASKQATGGEWVENLRRMKPYAEVLRIDRERTGTMARLDRERPAGWMEKRAALARLRDREGVPPFAAVLAKHLLDRNGSVPEAPFFATTIGDDARLPPAALDDAALTQELGGRRPVALALAVRPGPVFSWAARLEDGSTLGFQGTGQRGERPAGSANEEVFGDTPVSLRSASDAAGRRSLGEIVEGLSRALEVPAVAPGFRYPVPWPPPTTTAAGVVEWLRSTAGVTVRRVDGWLVFAVAKGEELEWGEPNETLLQVMEHGVAPAFEQRDPTFEQFAELLGTADKHQIARWQQGMVLTRFASQSIGPAAYALRFFASLDKGQRSFALAGRPILHADLTPTQQARFLEAFAAAPNPADLLRAIPDPRFDRKEIFRTELAFFLERDRSEGRNRTILRFGYGTDASVGYEVER